jgi:hypothetical protein
MTTVTTLSYFIEAMRSSKTLILDSASACFAFSLATTA